MTLDSLPLLPESSQPFSWDDYPESRAALVPGGQCIAFSSKTWLEIVNFVNSMRLYYYSAEVGGYFDAHTVWDNTYTTYDGAIMGAREPLSAAMFNSVRHNIEMFFKIGWGWAVDPDFRGYVGRKDFKGIASGNADLVYSEYILELVRGANLLHEVLRGTADMAEGMAQYNIPAPFVGDMCVRKSAPVKYWGSSMCDVQGSGISLPSVVVCASKKSDSVHVVHLRKTPSMPLVGNHIRAKSTHDASAFPAVSAALHYCSDPLQSLSNGWMDVADAVNLNIRFESATIEDGGGVALPSVPIVSESIGASAHDAMIAVCESAPICGTGIAGSVGHGAMVAREAIGVEASESSSTKDFAAYVKTIPKYGGTAERVFSKHDAVIDSAWYPPVWVDGGLWIRQSHSVTQNENGELVIM